jgi:hypothetical protein
MINKEDHSLVHVKGNNMNSNKVIGILFITGAIALLVPYTALTIIFDYPDILRQDAGNVLTKFYQGGNVLILTWFAFAVTGIPLIPAYILLGNKLENQSSIMRVATTFGVIGLVVQLIGLLRWTFVVPILAESFVYANSASEKASVVVAFKTMHQFGGVLLGEHIGQLFTIFWTIAVSYALFKLQLVQRWIALLGYVGSLIYVLAQAELFATVIPGFPFWDLAGFIGSTLWLLWIVVIGVTFAASKSDFASL